MARGFGNVKTISENRKSQGNFVNRNYLRLKDRESVVVRFLEQGDEVGFAYMHELPKVDDKFQGFVVCRDQDDEGERIGEECPGCDRELKRTFQGFINCIVRDAPVYEKDENGRMVRDRAGDFVESGTADQVFLLQKGITVFEELSGLDAAYKGLSSRDWRITRRGAKFNNTRYEILPADPDGGRQPMSKEDEKLAEQKYDIDELIAIPSIENYWGNESSKGDSVESVSNIRRGSPFRQRT